MISHSRLLTPAFIQGYRHCNLGHTKFPIRHCSIRPKTEQISDSPSLQTLNVTLNVDNPTFLKVNQIAPCKSKKEYKIENDPYYQFIKNLISEEYIQNDANIAVVVFANLPEALSNMPKFVKMISCKQFLLATAREYFKKDEFRDKIIKKFNSLLSVELLKKIESIAIKFCNAILEQDEGDFIKEKKALHEAFKIFKEAGEEGYPIFLL